MSLNRFGRTRTREEGRSRKRRRFGGGSYWSKEIRLPKAEDRKEGIRIAFPDCSYPDPDPKQAGKGEIPYFPYVDHSISIPKPKFQPKGSFLCTQGWDESNKQPCAACYAMDQGLPRNVDVRGSLRFAINVMVLEWFHLVPRLDRKTGQPRLYEKGDREGEPIMGKELCEGRGCKHCKDEHEKVFGAKRYLSFGGNFFENLRTIEESVSQRCLCGGYLNTVGYVCPICGETAIDLETAHMSDVEIDNLLQRGAECPHCHEKPFYENTGMSAFLPHHTCDTCDSPTGLSVIPEVGRVPAVVWLNRSGKGTSTVVNMTRFKPATEFVVPANDDVLMSIDEDEDGNDIIVWNPAVEDYGTPFDFPEMFKCEPTPQAINRQVELLRAVIPDFRNPYETGDEVKDYGKKGEDADYS